MMPGEISSRICTTAARRVWVAAATRRSAKPPGTDRPTPHAGPGSAPATLAFSSSRWQQVLPSVAATFAARQLLATAEGLMSGRAEILGFTFDDLTKPDWDAHPMPGYPDGLAAHPVGSDKAHWEISRGNILTQLAAASLLSGHDCYAERAGTLLLDWCEHFSAPVGPIWESGVELGIRMQSWTWLRRLSMFQTGGVFDSPSVRSAIANHLEILLRFPSSHSSANNHRLVEAAGLLTGGCCFSDLVDPGLASLARSTGLSILSDELALQVNSAGFHREQAVDYHCFVLEASLFALLEAELSGIEVPGNTWATVHRMSDALDALCDSAAIGPRFGDTDNSQVVQLDAAFQPPTRRTLNLMGHLTGGPAANRDLETDVRSVVVKAVVDTYLKGDRASLHRPRMPLTDRVALANQGTVVALRRTPSPDNVEIWMSLRSGPLGYLPIAAHAHADLNSIELRIDGRRFLVDPGTFLYGEDLHLRRVFRDTVSHNTLTVNGDSQARYSGPFLWGTDAVGHVQIDRVETPGGGGGASRPGPEITEFVSVHDGYVRRSDGPLHRRSVSLGDEGAVVTDSLLCGANSARPGGASTRPATFTVVFSALIDGQWSISLTGTQLTARSDDWTVRMELDPTLSWQLTRAAPDGTGWQATSYGHVEAASALRGTGPMTEARPVVTGIAWERDRP